MQRFIKILNALQRMILGTKGPHTFQSKILYRVSKIIAEREREIKEKKMLQRNVRSISNLITHRVLSSRYLPMVHDG